MRSIQAVESCCHDYQVAHSWLRVGSQCACASIRAPKALALLVLVRLLDLQAYHESERFRLDSCEASRRQVSASVLVGLVPLAASLAACVRLPLWCGREPSRGRGSRWSRPCVRARRARAARGISSRLRALASVVRQKAQPWQRFTEASILCPRLRGALLRAHRGAQASCAPLFVWFLTWVRTVLATEYRSSLVSPKAGPCAQLKCAFTWCVRRARSGSSRPWVLGRGWGEGQRYGPPCCRCGTLFHPRSRQITADRVRSRQLEAGPARARQAAPATSSSCGSTPASHHARS